MLFYTLCVILYNSYYLIHFLSFYTAWICRVGFEFQNPIPNEKWKLSHSGSHSAFTRNALEEIVLSHFQPCIMWWVWDDHRAGLTFFTQADKIEIESQFLYFEWSSDFLLWNVTFYWGGTLGQIFYSFADHKHKTWTLEYLISLLIVMKMNTGWQNGNRK